MRETTAQDQADYPGYVEQVYAWRRRHPWLVDGTLAIVLLIGAANAYIPYAAVLPASLALAGAVAVRRRCQSAERPRVLILTTFDLDEYAFEALRAGASGFLLKSAPPEELLYAVRSVHNGDSVVAPSTTRRLIGRFLPHLPVGATDRKDLAELTAREREVLTEVGSGLSNAEIAARLYISEATVKTHVGHILAKLGLRDRIQAVVYAYETGLVRPGG